MNNSRQPARDDILQHALERMAAGEKLDAVLRNSGQNRTWLTAMLQQASDVNALREQVVIPSAQASLSHFLAEGKRYAAMRRRNRFRSIVSLPRPSMRAVTMAFATVALLLAFSGFLGFNQSTFAQGVLPGHPLYSLKRLGEEILSIPHDELASRRRDEVRKLQEQNLEAEVAFSGIIDAIDDYQVVVSGIVCPLTCEDHESHMMEDAEVIGTLTTGARVLVEGYTLADGNFHVKRIVVER